MITPHAITVKDTYEDIVEACNQAWHFLIDDPIRIRSPGQLTWAYINILATWYRY